MMNGISGVSPTTSSISSSTTNLYITHITHAGPYLKIFGQLNRDAINVLTNRIEQLLPTCFMIEPSWSLARQQALLSRGVFCVLKQVNGPAPGDIEYMRARVVNASIESQVGDQTRMRVEIEFLDYGYNRVVNSHDLLFPKQPLLLQNVPVLCTQYIVLGICAEWEKTELEIVNLLIGKQIVQIFIQKEICGQKFVNVQIKDFNLAELLVQQKKIGAPIATELMIDHCRKMWKDSNPVPFVGNDNNNNNNTQSSAGKSATDLAREQIAARRSLSARLDLQRTILNQPIMHETPQSQPQQQQPIFTGPSAAAAAAAALPLTNLTNRMQLNFHHQSAAIYGNNHRNTNNYQPHVPVPTIATVAAAAAAVAPMAIDLKSNRMYYNNVRMSKPVTELQQQSQLLQQQQQQYQIPIAKSGFPPRFMGLNRPELTQPPAPSTKLPPTQAIQTTRIIPAFKTTSLTVGLTYDAVVSYVENGPHFFWIQLSAAMKDLTMLMENIERKQLQPMSRIPVVGTACVARFSVDGNKYRALIGGISINKVRVVYVDYGNSELVELRDLYHIPVELLEIKPFAYRFSLAGIKQLGPMDESMKQIFKGSALYKNFQLTVLPAESVISMQCCDLTTMEGHSMLEMLRASKMSRQAYPKADPLQSDDSIEIRYIDSPSNFYVQKVENIKQFELLMDEMFVYYNAKQKVPDELVLGSPCIVKCDQEWYRAEILRVDSAAIIVRHVDFGYEQKVKKHLIGIIAEKHLKMPRQAIKCCLKGFENHEMSQDKITDQFEMLAEESNIRRRTFTVRIFRIEPDGLNVVNLLAKNLNVMKKLYKLSMPFEQYLSLEKEEFNAPPLSTGATAAHPSLSSTITTETLERGNVLNSTTVESEDRMRVQVKQQQQHQQQQQQHQQQQQQQPQHATTIRGKSTEWDKHSSASSSKDTNRDQPTGVAATGEKERLTTGNVKRRGDRIRDTQADSSFDSRSNSSYTSGMSSPRKGRNARTNGPSQSQRLQNGEAAKTTRFNESPRKGQNQRSQNAPQGFAQKPQRQKSTLDGTQISRKTTSGESSDGGGSSDRTNEKKPEIYMPLEKPFTTYEIKTPVKEKGRLTWWVSPFQFYIVPKSTSSKYDNLLRAMQQFYRKKPNQPLQLKVGSSVVVHQRKDNQILRAQVQNCNQMQRKYRVFCIDTGKLMTITSEDVWQVEQRFAEPPCLAYRCSFEGVVTNYDNLYIVDQMDKYVPDNANIECEFIEKQNMNTFIVNLYVNGVPLRETLIEANYLTKVPSEVCVSLLTGQQIRGKFTSIRDMCNFKIQMECAKDVNFLCSYDDSKFIKSNPDLAKPFVDFYMNKSFAFNVTRVCENNIIHLRPIMPLFKEDRETFICSYPIIKRTFKAQVVYASKLYRIYVQPNEIQNEVKLLLDKMYTYYNEKNKGMALSKFETGKICAVHSADGNWYRARLEYKVDAAIVRVYYIDYGNTEEVSRDNIKVLEKQFYVDKSSYGIEINLPIGRCTNNSNNNNSGNANLKEPHEFLSKLVEEQVVTVNPIEMRRGHLIADVFLSNNQSIVDALITEKLIVNRNLDNIRKMLDKDRPFLNEHYETVDLTLTTDDDVVIAAAGVDEKKKQSNKQQQQLEQQQKKEKAAANVKTEKNSSSPKKVQKSTTASATPTVASIAPEPTPPAVAVAVIETKVAELPPPSQSPPPVAIVGSETESEIIAVVPAPDPYKDLDKAVLSHCDNPTQFFIHQFDKLDQILKLQENLQIVSSSLPQLMNVVNGAACISLYSVDKQWYRAKIIDAELMVLKFIDFGNTDCVSDTTDVKESMWHVEPFCMPCALPICPKGTADWVDSANTIFNDSYTKYLRIEYLTRGDCNKRSYINLYIDGIDVAKKLIDDGYAKPLEIVTSGATCFISHINGISDFYIQLERDCKALELIEMYLKNAEEHLEPLKMFEKSKIVAALFEDDELWYRAELLRELPDQRYEVRFIDYGNRSSTPKCLIMSEEIAKIPSLSKKCSLQLPDVNDDGDEYIGWSDEAENKFIEITGDGEIVFTIELLQPAVDHVVINLFVDEVNVITNLLPLCPRKEPKIIPIISDIMASITNITIPATTTIATATELPNNSKNNYVKAIVTHVQSSRHFYLQFDETTSQIVQISEKLNNNELIPLSSTDFATQNNKFVCVAQFKEDNEFYRVRILESLGQEYRVKFIDYGNQAMVDKLYELPIELADIKPLAEPFTLPHCDRLQCHEQLTADAFNALVDSCNGEVDVHYVNQSAVPPVVKLYTTGANALNIYEQLQKLVDNKLKIIGESSSDNSSDCIISHGISPRSFFIQLKKNSNNLDAIVKNLQSYKITDLSKIEEPTEQLIGICHSAEDDCFYRCRINIVLPNHKGCVVSLIDYGSTMKTTDVYKIPENVFNIEPMAVHCKLDGIPDDVEETKLNEAFVQLLENHFGEVYEIVNALQLNADPPLTVQLRTNYKDLTKELANMVAGIEKPVMAELHNCIVVQYDSPTSFYIQMEKDVPALEQMTDKLLDAEDNFPILTDLKVGALCAAQFAEDGVFYRAEILKLLDDGGQCEVHFVDFGNNAITNQLRQLPDELQQPTRYSKHCELESSTVAKCDLADLQSFIDTRFSDTFQVEILTTNNTIDGNQHTQVVRLYYDNTNISVKLRQQKN